MHGVGLYFITGESCTLGYILGLCTNSNKKLRSLQLVTISSINYDGIAFTCEAPSTAVTQGTLVGAKSSALGTLFFGQSASSIIPNLIMYLPGNDSPVRKRVVPQSPQKLDVMVLPVSAVFDMVLGDPIALGQHPTIYAEV